MGIAGT
jgi:Ca2+ transporting ATPase